MDVNLRDYLPWKKCHMSCFNVITQQSCFIHPVLKALLEDTKYSVLQTPILIVVYKCYLMTSLLQSLSLTNYKTNQPKSYTGKEATQSNVANQKLKLFYNRHNPRRGISLIIFSLSTPYEGPRGSTTPSWREVFCPSICGEFFFPLKVFKCCFVFSERRSRLGRQRGCPPGNAPLRPGPAPAAPRSRSRVHV